MCRTLYPWVLQTIMQVYVLVEFELDATTLMALILGNLIVSIAVNAATSRELHKNFFHSLTGAVTFILALTNMVWLLPLLGLSSLFLIGGRRV